MAKTHPIDDIYHARIVKKVKKVKAVYSASWETHLRATGRHLPYGITQCYLPPDNIKSTRPALTPASKLVLDLPTPEGWKAELT